MTKTIWIVMLIIIISLSSCNHAKPITPSETIESGIEVHVTEGPMCPGPVQVGDNSCPDKPYQATISVQNANKIQIARFQTDITGYFKIQLKPGTYTLIPEAGNPFPNAAEQIVTVKEGQYTQLTIVYDTGMR